MTTPSNRSTDNNSGAPEDRKAWAIPTIERQGSVAELVQQTKISGGDDNSGARRSVPAPPKQ